MTLPIVPYEYFVSKQPMVWILCRALLHEASMEDLDDYDDSDMDDDDANKLIQRSENRHSTDSEHVDNSHYNPDNFSRVDLTLSETAISKRFPDFPVRMW